MKKGNRSRTDGDGKFKDAVSVLREEIKYNTIVF
jgi:hypothetical protein